MGCSAPRSVRRWSGTILPGAGSIYISQTLAFHQPVRIDDVVHHPSSPSSRWIEAESARVEAELRGLRGRDQLIMDGVAVVRVPRRRKPSASADAGSFARLARPAGRRNSGAPPSPSGPSTGCIAGHQAVIADAKCGGRPAGRAAGRGQLRSRIPRRWFQTGRRAVPPDDRRTRWPSALAPLGVDILYLLPFDAEMAGMSGRRSSPSVMCSAQRPGHHATPPSVSTSPSARGGHRLARGFARAMARRLGFGVSTAPSVWTTPMV